MARFGWDWQGMARTNLQISIEQQRAVYSWLARPLLSQLCEVHGLSVRDMASIFGISKTFASEIMNHQKLPSLELGIRLARYFEVDVESLFGWMLDDDGCRRPLIVETPKGLVRLSSRNPHHGSLELVEAVAMEIYRREGPK